MKKEEKNERIFLEFRKDFLIGRGIFKISRSFRSILDIGCTVHNFRKLGTCRFAGFLNPLSTRIRLLKVIRILINSVSF